MALTRDFKCEGCGHELVPYIAQIDDAMLCSKCIFFSDVEQRVWDGVRAFAPNITTSELKLHIAMCVDGRKLTR